MKIIALMQGAYYWARLMRRLLVDLAVMLNGRDRKAETRRQEQINDPMLKQGRRRASLLLLASLLLAGCSALPQRGFATRFFQSDIEPELNPKGAFEGSPTIAPDGSVVPPGSCEAIARERAQDVAVQDFSLEVQQTVFDHTLRDCKAWRGRTGVLERRP